MKLLTLATVLTTFCFLTAGCATPSCILSTRNAIPAYQLPVKFRTCSRKGMVPLNLELLGQKRPAEGHRLGRGDLVGVYVGGVLPPKLDDQAVVLPQVAIAGNFYYPPFGRVNTPAIGVPLELRDNGTVRLPQVGLLDLSDQTLETATDIIRAAYEDKGIIQKDRDRVYLTLLRSRVRRVVVLRDDAQSPMPTFVPKTAVPFTKIGRGEVIDLPIYENDVLHALTASGGLPGIDAFSEVWIFRSRDGNREDPEVIQKGIQEAGSPQGFASKLLEDNHEIVRLPLRIDPCAPLPFGKDDVILEDGDVVYLPPREVEYFYTGGQLPGGRVPLPRDQDFDVLEAIALVNGSTGGPSSASIFRAGPGTIYPPTQALVVRKLPNGQKIRIRVDLNRALNDPAECILIQPEDQLLLFFKPSELCSNLLLNFVGGTVGYSGTSIMQP